LLLGPQPAGEPALPDATGRDYPSFVLALEELTRA
jgi:hypothetical protein